MKTIETQATVAPDGKLNLQVTVGMPPGEYHVVVILEERRPPKRGPLNFPVDRYGSWPDDLSMRREDLYDDE